VRLYSRDRVIKAMDDCWQHDIGVAFLKFFGKVISELAEAVETSVSNFWIWVVAVLYNHGDHDRQLLRVVNVFADLTESHNAGVFIAPIGIVGNRVLDQLADKRQHNFVTDA